MPKHVTELLDAYLDGQLNFIQSHSVEAHLAECEDCQRELESRERLSALLQDVPAPDFVPPERFTAHLMLRLPRSPAVSSKHRIFEIGWWMVPVGLLALWVSVSTLFFVNDLVAVARNAGLLTSIYDWLVPGLLSQTDWSAILAQLGILQGDTLHWAVSTEAFTRTSLLQITLQASIALLYLSWLAIGWARQWRYHHQQHGQLLENE